MPDEIVQEEEIPISTEYDIDESIEEEIEDEDIPVEED